MEVFYTIRQIADKLHKSEQSVARWIKDGKLEYIQISERRRVVSESTLEEFLDARRIVPPKKRIDKRAGGVAFSGNRSLTTSGERKAEKDVKSIRKEISRLWH